MEKQKAREEAMRRVREHAARDKAVLLQRQKEAARATAEGEVPHDVWDETQKQKQKLARRKAKEEAYRRAREFAIQDKAALDKRRAEAQASKSHSPVQEIKARKKAKEEAYRRAQEFADQDKAKLERLKRAAAQGRTSQSPPDEMKMWSFSKNEAYRRAREFAARHKAAFAQRTEQRTRRADATSVSHSHYFEEGDDEESDSMDAKSKSKLENYISSVTVTNSILRARKGLLLSLAVGIFAMMVVLGRETLEWPLSLSYVDYFGEIQNQYATFFNQTSGERKLGTSVDVEAYPGYAPAGCDQILTFACKNVDYELSSTCDYCVFTKKANNSIAILREVLQDWSIKDKCEPPSSRKMPLFAFSDIQRRHPSISVLETETLEKAGLVVERRSNGDLYLGLEDIQKLKYPLSCKAARYIQQFLFVLVSLAVVIIHMMVRVAWSIFCTYPWTSLIAFATLAFIRRRRRRRQGGVNHQRSKKVVEDPAAEAEKW